MLVVSARAGKSKIGPGKITSGQDKEKVNTSEMSKENIMNDSPSSLFESRRGGGSTEGLQSKVGGEGKTSRSALHARKRSLSESRLSAPPSTTRGRELSPPELTTSDNFKPAKRVLGPKPALEERKKLPPVNVGLPLSPAAPSSARAVPRLSITVDNRNFHSRSLKVGTSTNRNSSITRKSSLTGRRLSVVRLSVSKEKGMCAGPKEAVKEKMKETMKKVVVFAAKKAEQQTSPEVQMGVKKVCSRVREKNVASAKSPVQSVKPPSMSVKPEVVAKEESTTKSRVVASQSGSTKSKVENTRMRKLSMVLKTEQRLQEQNQQLELQLRQLQEELARKDDEIERLRSAGLILNNLAKNQSDEVRDIKFRLKETLNENAEVRDICEKLEKELQEGHAARKKAKEEELNNKALEVQLVSLTSQLQNMGVGLPQSGGKLQRMEPSGRTNEDHEVMVEEPTFEVHSEVQEDVGNKVYACDSESEVPSGAREWSATFEEIIEEGPVITNDEDVHYALQDLQEIIFQEETSLRDRCADALKALNMPLSPLLTSHGVLDVDSLKALVVSVSSRGTEFSTHRFNSVFRF